MSDAIEPTEAPPRASLVAWGTPTPVVTGRRISLKVGVACQCGCDLSKARLVVRNEAGEVVAQGVAENLRSEPEALYWTELDLAPPSKTGVARFSVACAELESETPHAASGFEFTLRIEPPPEHWVTVRALSAETGAPVANAEIGLNTYLARTDVKGEARFHVPSGAYSCFLRKFGFKLEPVTLVVQNDVVLHLDVEKGETREELERRLSMMENHPWG